MHKCYLKLPSLSTPKCSQVAQKTPNMHYLSRNWKQPPSSQAYWGGSHTPRAHPLRQTDNQGPSDTAPPEWPRSANMVTPHTDAEWISLLTWNSFSFWACSDPSLLQDLYEWEKVNTSGEMGNNQQTLTLQPPEQPGVTKHHRFLKSVSQSTDV